MSATAAVTGGTHGLGLEIAAGLSARGHDVLIGYAHDDDRAAVALERLAQLPGKAFAHRADVGTAAGSESFLDAARTHLGHVDVLVHSASTHHPAPTAELDPARALTDAHTAWGPLFFGVPAMLNLVPDGGRIVAVSSSGARSAVPGYAGLGAGKAGLEALVRYLAVQLAGRGVTVNAVAPGKLDDGRLPAPAAAAMAARTPAGRLTRHADVVDVVALLCRPEARWLHGQVLTVDGGLGLLA